MKEYPKINSVFKRFTEGENKGKFNFNVFSQPEFAYLYHNEWIGTEKVDGTNCRIIHYWNEDKRMMDTEIRGRTNKAQIPSELNNKLIEIVNSIDFSNVFSINEPERTYICLFGEGYGKKIQKVGSKYIPNGNDFILFDVFINGWWLKRDDVVEIAKQLGLKVVPIIAYGSLKEMVEFVKNGFQSKVAQEDMQAEGLVLQPSVPLFARNGGRVITKLKTSDFT